MSKNFDNKISNSYKSTKDLSNKHDEKKHTEIFNMLEHDIDRLKILISNYKNTFHCSSSLLSRCDITKNKPIIDYTQTDIDTLMDFKNIVSTIFDNIDEIYSSLSFQPISNIRGFKKKSYKYESDEKQEIKDIATKIVYNNLLTRDAIGSILVYVSEIWNVCIADYVEEFNKVNSEVLDVNDIKLLYRGGNTLSSILDEFLKHVPPLLSAQLKVNFGDVMAKSDVDFTIIINPYKYPHGKLHDEIFNKVSIITSAILSRIRKLIMVGKMDIFKPNLTEDVFKLFLEKLNNSECVKVVSENNSSLKGFKFVRVVYDDKYYESQNLDDVQLNHILGKYNNGCHTNVAGSSHDDIQTINFGENSIIQKLMFPTFEIYNGPEIPNSSLYMTYKNDSVFGTKKIIHRFSLARLKVNFRLYYLFDEKLNVINLPGEFIDFSVTNNDITNINLNLESSAESDIKEKWDNIKKYKFVQENEKTVELYSFTIDYYFTDISNMLFKLLEHPWENKKYAKLLKRLFLLSLINLLSKVKEDGIVMKFDIHILDFMDKLTNFDIKTLVEYIEPIDGSLYYLKLLKMISEVAENIKEDNAKLLTEFEKFNVDVQELFVMSNGLIKSSFSKTLSTNTIINAQQNVIQL